MSRRMELFYHPDRLITLAVQALGDYIAGLLVTSRHLDNVDHIIDVLKCIGHELEIRVPPLLAQDVTGQLLACLYSVWSDRLANEVRSQALNTVFLPSVSRIEFSTDDPHPAAEKFYLKYILSGYWEEVPLHKLRCLKSLRFDCDVSDLSSNWMASSKQVLENLNKFSLRGTDAMLYDLVKLCPGLKSLNLKDKELGITNHCITTLLQFDSLEDLQLNCMHITSNGLITLLTGLPEKCKRLKSFGCYQPSDIHLSLIAGNLKNLTSLSLSQINNSSLMPLKDLEQLKTLSLKDMPFLVVQDLLWQIGPQLLCLELSQVYDADLRVSCEACPSLRCLHFKYKMNSKWGFPRGHSLIPYDTDFPLPKFECVTCLSLCVNDVSFTHYVVTRFVNLRKLYVIGGDHGLLEEILQRKNHKHLEQFFWKRKSKVTEVVLHDKHALLWAHNYDSGERFHLSARIRPQ